MDPMEEEDKDPYYEGGNCGGMRQERRVGFFAKEGMLEIFSRLVEGINELKSNEYEIPFLMTKDTSIVSCN